MCEFCDNLEWRTYRFDLRNFGADNNVCEYVSAKYNKYDDTSFIDEYGICYSGTIYCDDCDGCKNDNLLFGLNTYDNYFGFCYYHKIRDLIIVPSSEMVKFNYCPWCGKQIVDDKDKVPFERCYFGSKLKLVEYE